MPEHRHTPWSGDDAVQGRWALAHRETVASHSHARGQLLYAAGGVLATTTEHGTWVSPADRISWTPPHFEHRHRAYGRTELGILEVPEELCDGLPDHPRVFTVSALLREVVLKLTDGRLLRPGAGPRLLRVAVDELLDLPEYSLYLPEPADDRLRAITEALKADPADPATLTELGREAGAGERTLSRLFRTELGMTFYQWRTLLRIQHALVHLAQGRSVTRVRGVVRLGESDQLHRGVHGDRRADAGPLPGLAHRSAVTGSEPGNRPSAAWRAGPAGGSNACAAFFAHTGSSGMTRRCRGPKIWECPRSLPRCRWRSASAWPRGWTPSRPAR